jgi:hypothetical protein
MLHKDYNRKCSVEKNTGRETQAACRQDELIGDKPQVTDSVSSAVLKPVQFGSCCEIGDSQRRRSQQTNNC